MMPTAPKQSEANTREIVSYDDPNTIKEILRPLVENGVDSRSSYGEVKVIKDEVHVNLIRWSVSETTATINKWTWTQSETWTSVIQLELKLKQLGKEHR